MLIGNTMKIDIEDLQDVIDELERVSTKRIKAESRLEQEMEVLDSLGGYATIKEAEKASAKLSTKIDKRRKDFDEEVEEFLEDYSELLD